MAGEETNKWNPWKPFNILMIEDDETDVEIIQRAFAKGMIKNRLFVVCDGTGAFDFVNGKGKYSDREKYPKPDIILLDINLPKVNGFQILESLKLNPASCSIPVVMLTSSKNRNDISKSYDSGASSFIQKPVSFEDFVRVVEGFNFYWHVINKLPEEQKGAEI